MKGKVFAVTGIDTGIGKSVVTGLLARALQEQGRSVITQKIVQTGCTNEIADDIVEHRRLMGIPLQEVDREGITAPYIFPFPASPHLAASLAGATIDPMQLRRATFFLQKRYEIVLLEGVGGVLVPLTPDLLFADYIAQAGYAVLLVTSPRLGSINHTLLSLEACQWRGITIRALFYNHFGYEDILIANDTRQLLTSYLHTCGIDAPIIDVENGALSREGVELLHQLF
uniref:ATP-dependent dethiobiotin synthetase BioD n=1 Tax=Chlorobium chlorochromatii (strain CaD3) TaxID=340177 RepID=Q3ANZ1_CHLCH